MTPPEGLPSFEDDENTPHFSKPQNIDFDDIPIAYTFSSLLTSLNSIVIFLVPVAGFLSLVYVNRRIKKMDREINEVIFEEKITMLDENELRRILSFGEEQV